MKLIASLKSWDGLDNSSNGTSSLILELLKDQAKLESSSFIQASKEKS